jgi:hypothetical protein
MLALFLSNQLRSTVMSPANRNTFTDTPAPAKKPTPSKAAMIPVWFHLDSSPSPEVGTNTLISFPLTPLRFPTEKKMPTTDCWIIVWEWAARNDLIGGRGVFGLNCSRVKMVMRWWIGAEFCFHSIPLA